MNDIRNNLPKIIRTDDKIDETIQAHNDAIYKTLHVPLSQIDLAKKDFPCKHVWFDEKPLEELSSKELVENLENCRELVEEYEEKVKKRFGE